MIHNVAVKRDIARKRFGKVDLDPHAPRQKRVAGCVRIVGRRVGDIDHVDERTIRIRLIIHRENAEMHLVNVKGV